METNPQKTKTMIDHTAYINQEIVAPIVNRLDYFFRVNKIEPGSRVEVFLVKHDVTFSGLFQDDGSLKIIGPIKYDRVFITMNVRVDGLPVIEDAHFEFTRDYIQNPVTFSEAIDGSAFTLYRKIEPVLSNGFCSGCNQPYSRDEKGGLVCECIKNAHPKNPD